MQTFWGISGTLVLDVQGALSRMIRRLPAPVKGRLQLPGLEVASKNPKSKCPKHLNVGYAGTVFLVSGRYLVFG